MKYLLLVIFFFYIKYPLAAQKIDTTYYNAMGEKSLPNEATTFVIKEINQKSFLTKEFYMNKFRQINETKITFDKGVWRLV